MQAFKVEHALLLVDDEEDRIMLTEDESLKSNVVEDEKNQPEIFILKSELERIWTERSKIHWGMPGKVFSEMNALLLLDDGDDMLEEEKIEYQNTKQITLKSEEKDFWSLYAEDPDLNDGLKSAFSELEDRSFRRPAWKKERHILTPGESRFSI